MSKTLEIIMPTAEEDAAITAAAQADPDAQALTDEELAQFKRAVGRPPSAMTKVPTSLRLDREVLNAFKTSGTGWQTRINEVLREWAMAQGLLENEHNQPGSPEVRPSTGSDPSLADTGVKIA